MGRENRSREEVKRKATNIMLRKKLVTVFGLLLLVVVVLPPSVIVHGSRRVIEVIADKDNRFKVPGQKKPVIMASPREVLRLRITARKGPEWDRDGAVHGLTIKQLVDQGWNLRLKEGTEEFTLVAPEKPGEYVIECTVMCGEGHDDMKMKLIVR